MRGVLGEVWGGGGPGGSVWGGGGSRWGNLGWARGVGAHAPKAKRWSITGSAYLPLLSL